jgi:thiol-disulfide isomerase/thioredoxin
MALLRRRFDPCRAQALRLILGGVVLFGPGCEGKTGAKEPAPAAAGAAAEGSAPKHPTAPALDLAILGGGDWKIEDKRGQVLLINVWATWCKPCRAELPELARLHREHAPRGFSVVGVSVDPSRKEPEVARMVEEMDLPFPVLLDPDNVTVHDWAVTGYPTSFVIDRSGGIRFRRDGIIYEHDEELAATIHQSVGESAAGGSATP